MGNSIGAMLFDNVEKIDIPENNLNMMSEAPIDLPMHSKKTFWEYLSRIWGFLKSGDRDTWESFWDALVASGFSMDGKAQDFIDAVDPTKASTDIFEYFYDMKIGASESIPTNLYPELPTNSYTIRPIGVKLETPVVKDGEVSRYDIVSISAADYHAIRSVGLGQYAVLTSRGDGGDKKVFKIHNLLSSEEPEEVSEFAEFNLDKEYPGVFGAIGITNKTNDTKAKCRFLFKEGDNKVGDILVDDFTMDADGVDGYVITINKINGIPVTVKRVVDELNNNTTSTISSNFEFSPRSREDQLAPYYPASAVFPRDRTRYTDMPKYNPAESGNGRFVPYSSYIWTCYDTSGHCGTDDAKVEGAGYYRPDLSSAKYYVQVDGDLTNYSEDSFTMHLTTGRAYRTAGNILNVPNLQTSIKGKPEYYKNDSFTMYDDIIEFETGVLEESQIMKDGTLYCSNAPAINDSLFSMYGGLVGVTDWNAFKFDNVTAKASISSLMMSLQNSDRLDEYARSLNVYYNLPIVPYDSKTYGVYESYGYDVVSVDNSTRSIVLGKESGVELSRLIQTGTLMLTSTGNVVRVGDISRDDGVVTLDTTGSVVPGTKLYTGLQNKMRLRSATAEAEYAGDEFAPPSIIVECESGCGAMQHVVDIYSRMFSGEKYPELVVYGTEDDGYDNSYHITKAEDVPGNYGLVKLTLYSPRDKDLERVANGRVIYNDFIRADKDDIKKGFAHFSWPTHKFLLLWMKEQKAFHISYMDAPIDTILSSGEDVDQYDIICRNVSVLDKNSFPGWYQYDQFRFSNGMDEKSSIVESTSIIDGAEFGTYFPAELKD